MSEKTKIEPAAPMYAVIRLDNRGTPFVDALTADYDVAGVHRRLNEVQELCPPYERISPAVHGPNGEMFAVVEMRFVRWLGDRK